MEHKYTISNGACTILIGQKMHQEHVESLMNLIEELWKTPQFSTLAFDMEQCLSISSAGIGMIISVARQSKDRNLQFELRHCQDKVLKLLSVTGVSTIVNIQ